MSQESIALIVGASRGLGLGLVREYLDRGWRVIATERAAGSSAGLAELKAQVGERLTLATVDINIPEQIRVLAAEVIAAPLDLLFVNAGVSDDPSLTIGQVASEEFARVFQTNALAPMRVVDWLGALVAPRGTIAVMTSALGSISGEQSGGYEVYGASKAALNKLFRGYAVRAGAERSLLAIMPGWVQTDMGGADAPLDVATSVRGIADAVATRCARPGIAFIDYQNTPVAW
jgi:NAD(P)-dependent dehydrogenase (short-subunit alcohol dehydrogenase family)